MAKKQRQVGYAVIGLGHIVQHAVLPAFQNAKGARLVALVSGDKDKRQELGTAYDVPTFDYAQLEDCLDMPEVEAVYIGLPNDLHAEYVERCARKGVHVLCEKPLAISSDECMRMIRACEEADVWLMTAYRLHLEKSNLKAVQAVERGDIGEPRFFSSTFSYQVQGGNIRTIEERGGGPQWDIGIYCLNATRYLFRDEPTEVFAWSATKKGDARFSETPEQVAVLLRYPNERLAQFTVSFGAAPSGTYTLVGTKGVVQVENAYEYEGERKLRVIVEEQKHKKRFKPSDQFGPELEYFAECVLEGREPEMNGWEGLADVRVIEAINRSIEEGKPIKLEPFERRRRPEPEMAREEPSVVTEDLVNAEAPHQG